MKISNWLNIVLGLALVAVGIRFATGSTQALSASDCNDNDTENPAIANIMTRCSIRSFTDQSVSSDHVETLLRAAMAAPTARDSRPWHFVVVTDTAMLRQIAVEMPNAKPVGEAPLAIVVCGATKRMLEGEAALNWVADCSAATENLLLAAHALHLGAVWCGVWPDETRSQKTRDLISLPDTLVPLDIIAIGHPASYGKVKDKWDADRVTYLPAP